MNLLGLDTSSVACSVAVKIDRNIFARHEEKPREHTRLLMPMIRDVLRESGAHTGDLDAIVLGNGPGSFIGMRIAASVAQGLAHGAGLKIIPASSLAAVAAQVFAESDASEVAVAQDAHMSEVYLGIFARGNDDLPVPQTEERLQRLEVIAEFEGLESGGRIAAGYGWRRYPDLATANNNFFESESIVYYPNARFLLPLSAAASAIMPEDIAPAYLRQKVADKPATLSQYIPDNRKRNV